MTAQIVRNLSGEPRVLLVCETREEMELLDRCEALELVRETRDGQTGRIEDLAFEIVALGERRPGSAEEEADHG